MTKKLLIALCFIWLGLVLGISFLEAPLKFQAPGITIKLGLGIGRLVFTALNRIEFVFMVTTGIMAWAIRFYKPGFVLIAILSFTVLFQTFYLLPALDERALKILAGEIVPASFHHHLYIYTEVFKIVILISSGMYYLSKLNGNETRHQFT